MSLDLSDPMQVADRNKELRSRESGVKGVVKGIMSTPTGRRWVYDFLVKCHLYTNPFSGEKPLTTAFMCGEMNIGQQLLAEVQATCPQQYSIMIEEANGRPSIDDSAGSKRAATGSDIDERGSGG